MLNSHIADQVESLRRRFDDAANRYPDFALHILDKPGEKTVIAQQRDGSPAAFDEFVRLSTFAVDLLQQAGHTFKWNGQYPDKWISHLQEWHRSTSLMFSTQLEHVDSGIDEVSATEFRGVFRESALNIEMYLTEKPNGAPNNDNQPPQKYLDDIGTGSKIRPVFKHLWQNRGNYVKFKQLNDKFWSDNSVTDEAISKTIYRIRTAMSKHPEVEVKFGYREVMITTGQK